MIGLSMPIRVAIAEDNWLTPMVLRTELEAHGYEVVGVATNGTDTLELCRRERPDVVLMDIRMPGVDGVEATRVLLEECPACVVMVTGDAGLSQASEEAGAMGYLVKPFLPDEIVTAIEGALQRFARFRAVRAEAGGRGEVMEAWHAVRKALARIADRERVRDEEAFARLRQTASSRGMTLREAAEAVLIGEAQASS